jgi:hypothetical protein
VRGAGVHVVDEEPPGRRERLAEPADCFGRHGPVVVGVPEDELCARLRDAEVRAVGVVGRQTTPVETTDRRDLVGVRGGGADREAGPHAVADAADAAVGAALAQGGEVRRGVGRQVLRGQGPDPLHRVVAVVDEVGDRPVTVEDVRRQHRVAPPAIRSSMSAIWGRSP